ncbi:hypothetical protein CNYM01_01077 [Colletotrichum nymphaeae SA-01]|uniref:CorA-like Mg2+ transporter n=1 Tax=Colletotrichum nymphaeae SA-01 TaxID=1460502 RepID=A0A135SEE0_9PEZI|nr:hypothetical protein CNYM01_01077 [Colletotrichum nymphaeae SA-01]
MSSKAENLYWEFLKSTQSEPYPNFVQYLSQQKSTLRDEGRAAIIHFEDQHKPTVTICHTPTKLGKQLDRSADSRVPVRRLMVLEGLSKQFVQVLGARLRVPPGLFSAHWTATGAFVGNLVNRAPRQYDPQTQFLVSFSKLHPVEIESLPDNSDPVYLMESGAFSPLSRSTIFGGIDGPLNGPEQVSFWGTRDEEDWQGVILVDPPLGDFVRWMKSNELRKVLRRSKIENLHVPDGNVQQGSWYPLFQSQEAMSHIPSDWSSSERTPRMESLFEDLILLYPLNVRKSTSDMYACTDICRRLVLSAWTARLRTIEIDISRERTNMRFQPVETGGIPKEHLELSWTRPGHGEDFGRLSRATAALDSLHAEFVRNMDSLGITSESGIVIPWEADAWRHLERANQLLKTRVDSILQTYMQAITVRQTIDANEQARQVGHLTSMATIFIPISFVAAVFSMGGDFSAGAGLFWVFWVIAIPMVSIGCFLLFTRFGKRLLRRMSQEKSMV